jgi:hypothetical protein
MPSIEAIEVVADPGVPGVSPNTTGLPGVKEAGAIAGEVSSAVLS